MAQPGCIVLVGPNLATNPYNWTNQNLSPNMAFLCEN